MRKTYRNRREPKGRGFAAQAKGGDFFQATKSGPIPRSRRIGNMARKPSSESPLRLSLFGGPVLERGGERFTTSPYQGALLGLLASHGRRGVARGKMMDLLWRDGTDAQLRRRMSQLVYSLRRKVGAPDLIRLETEAYVLNVDRVETDLEEFLITLRERRVSEALGFVQQGFLTGLTQPPTPDMERWIQERDHRFRSDVRSLAVELWAEAEQRADWEMAVLAAETLLTLDPDDEAFLAQLMKAATLAHSPSEARARFRRFAEMRHVVEPEWQPQEQTLDLLDRLEEIADRRGDYVTVHERARTSDPPLVGRDPELEKLTRLMRHPPEEGMTTAVVTGEAGIGKTRLVREALQRAPFDGVRVLEGKCSEFEQNIPLSPILRCLSPDWVRREIDGLDDPWRTVVLSLLPEASNNEPAVPVGSAVETRSLHEIPRVVCEALTRLLARIGGEEALVIFLDDFQWVDATSLSVLEYVRNSWECGALLLVAAVRPEELSEGSREQRWLEGRASADQPVRIELGPLDPEDMAVLVEEAVSRIDSSEPDESEAHRSQLETGAVEELAGGHPLLALECIRAYAAPAADLRAGTRGAAVPEALQRLIVRRRSDLSKSAQNLLDCLSLNEKSTPLSVVQSVRGSSSRELSSDLDEAIAEQFVTVTPRGIEFRHGLFREVVYRQLPEGRRTLLHQKTAEALASFNDRSLAPDVALHFFEAGEPRRAVPHVLEAARAATTSGGWSEARSLLETALRGDPATEERAALASALGRFLVLEGAFEQGEKAWTDAAKAFHTVGNEEEALRCRVCALEARSFRPDVDRDALVKEVQRLRADTEDQDLPRVTGECMTLQIRILDSLRRLDDVRELIAEARLRADEAAPGSDLPFLFVSAVDALYGNPEAAVSLAERAVEIALKQGTPDLALKALNWKIIADCQRGRLALPEGQSTIRQARAVAREAQDIDQRFHLEKNVGSWNLDVGDYESAARAFHRCEVLLDGIEHPRLRRLLLLDRGHLALELGRFDQAISHFQAAANTAEVAGHQAFRWTVLSGLGLSHLSHGNLEEARRLRDEVPSHDDHWSFAPFDPYLWLTFQAHALRLLNRDPGTACGFLARHEPYLKEQLVPSWIRICLLRFDISARHGLPLDAGDILEVERIAVRGKLHGRAGECVRILQGEG